MVYSKEPPVSPAREADVSSGCREGEEGEAETVGQKRVPGSVAFVPSVVGLIIAGEVLKDIGYR